MVGQKLQFPQPHSIEYENAFYRIECFLVFYRMELVFYSKSEKKVRKDFQGLSPTKEVIALMSTHLLCKRLHYVLSVNRIHTREYFLVWTEFKLLVMISFMTVTVVMPMDRWRIMTGAYYQFPQPHWSAATADGNDDDGRRHTLNLYTWQVTFFLSPARSVQKCNKNNNVTSECKQKVTLDTNWQPPSKFASETVNLYFLSFQWQYRKSCNWESNHIIEICPENHFLHIKLP